MVLALSVATSRTDIFLFLYRERKDLDEVVILLGPWWGAGLGARLRL